MPKLSSFSENFIYSFLQLNIPKCAKTKLMIICGQHMCTEAISIKLILFLLDWNKSLWLKDQVITTSRELSFLIGKHWTKSHKHQLNKVEVIENVWCLDFFVRYCYLQEQNIAHFSNDKQSQLRIVLINSNDIPNLSFTCSQTKVLRLRVYFKKLIWCKRGGCLGVYTYCSVVLECVYWTRQRKLNRGWWKWQWWRCKASRKFNH